MGFALDRRRRNAGHRLSLEQLERRELMSVTPSSTATDPQIGSGAASALVQSSDQSTGTANAGGDLTTSIAEKLAAAQAATAPDTSLSIYNVKDPAYGAFGNAVTDDSAAITAAIDDAHAAGGGIIYFPRGNYVAQGLPMYQNVYFEGAGQGVSTVELPTSPSADLFDAAATAQFTHGGFMNISLYGRETKQFDGISFANVSQSTNEFELSHVDIVGFRNGFYGSNDFGTFMTNDYIGDNVNGIVDFENPFIINSRINGNTIGLTGRLADALMVENYFSSNHVGAQPQFGQPFRQTTFTGNIFTGNSYINLVIDDQNTLNGNVFEGSLTSSPTLIGILIRGNGNVISGNKIGLESSSPTIVSQDFGYGAIVFNSMDYTGGPIAGGAIGSNTVISNNIITAQTGSAINTVGNVNLIGLSVTNNSFDLWNQTGLLYNNAPGVAYGDKVSDNTFMLKKSTMCPAISISGPGGNSIVGNQFIVGGGVQTSYLVAINASTTVFTSNQAINLPVGQPAWNFTATDANTVIANNLATDANGQGLQVSQASGQTMFGPAVSSINVTYPVTSLIRTPAPSDITVSFASNPFNASAIWITNVTASGFTINLNDPPGQGSTIVAWKVLLT